LPNGGPDNCSTCGFNRRNAGVWRNSAPDESSMPFCEIRGVPILNDHWTYCQNWHTREPVPVGPIYTSGIYDGGYRRIPWHGAVQPEFVHTGLCNECHTPVNDGISIPSVEGAPLIFCCNLHYLEWWKRQHPGEDAPMSRGIDES
jgi:hypothetical protein